MKLNEQKDFKTGTKLFGTYHVDNYLLRQNFTNKVYNKLINNKNNNYQK